MVSWLPCLLDFSAERFSSSPFPKRKRVGTHSHEKWGELSSLATSSSWFQVWKAHFGMVNSLLILHLLLFCNKHMLVMQIWLCLGFRSPLGFESSPRALQAGDLELFKLGCFFAVAYSVAVCSWSASHPWCTKHSLGELQKNTGVKNKVILVCWETYWLHQGIHQSSWAPELHHQTGTDSSSFSA